MMTTNDGAKDDDYDDDADDESVVLTRTEVMSFFSLWSCLHPSTV